MRFVAEPQIATCIEQKMAFEQKNTEVALLPGNSKHFSQSLLYEQLDMQGVVQRFVGKTTQRCLSTEA